MCNETPKEREAVQTTAFLEKKGMIVPLLASGNNILSLDSE